MIMEQKTIKTPYQREKEARELSIYKERKEMMSTPGNMATAVDQILMKKYHIHSKSTIWFIVNRVEARLSEEQQ
jgi:hypothetical protein